MARCRGAVAFRDASRSGKQEQEPDQEEHGSTWKDIIRSKKSSLLRVVYDSPHVMAGYLSLPYPNPDTLIVGAGENKATPR